MGWALVIPTLVIPTLVHHPGYTTDGPLTRTSELPDHPLQAPAGPSGARFAVRNLSSSMPPTCTYHQMSINQSNVHEFSQMSIIQSNVHILVIL